MLCHANTSSHSSLLIEITKLQSTITASSLRLHSCKRFREKSCNNYIMQINKRKRGQAWATPKLHKATAIENSQWKWKWNWKRNTRKLGSVQWTLIWYMLPLAKDLAYLQVAQFLEWTQQKVGRLQALIKQTMPDNNWHNTQVGR